MADIGERIKKLRMEKGRSQEELAEVLCVTRQTVSAWETGRSEPSLDMLSAISEALGVGLDDIIPIKPYKKGQIRYKVLAAAGGVITLAGLALKLWLEPALRWEMKAHYNVRPLFLFRYAAVPVFAAAFAVFLLSLLALSRDVYSGSKRKLFLTAGILLALPWLVTAMQLIFSDLNGLKLLVPWRFLLSENAFVYTLLIPFLSGACLFLGLNRK